MTSTQAAVAFTMAVMIFLPLPALADGTAMHEALQFCEIDGFASGVNNRLVGQLAQRAAARAGVSQISNKQCDALFTAGLKAGQRDRAGAVLSDAEMAMARRMQAFEKQLLDALLDLMDKR